MILNDDALYNPVGSHSFDKYLITAEKVALGEVDWTQPSLFRYTMKVSNDYTEYIRNDYTLMTFLGDVGALFSTLVQIVGFILLTILRLGFKLDSHLIVSIFRTRKSGELQVKKNFYPKSILKYFWLYSAYLL